MSQLAIRSARSKLGTAGHRLMVIREPDDGDEHQHAARHRVEDELDRGVDAALVAPDPDEEIHRNQHRVPEDVEQEQVERDEDADHGGFEREHEERELAHARIRPTPSCTSSAIGVRNVVSTTSSRLMPSTPTWYEMPKSGSQAVALDQLILGRRRVELRPHQQADGKRGQRDDERQLPCQRRTLLRR